jgi:hypothetical protein
VRSGDPGFIGWLAWTMEKGLFPGLTGSITSVGALWRHDRYLLKRETGSENGGTEYALFSLLLAIG